VVAFANSGGTLLPGMTANVRIVTDTRDDVLKVSNAALRVRIAGVEPQRGEASGVVPAAVAQTNGPLAELRNRLVAELSPTAAQLERIDAILAAQRARFAELRALPDEERSRARERIVADLRAQIGATLTEAQQPRYQALLAELSGRQTTRGRIYLLGADQQPRAVNVRLGITDGTATELIVPPNAPDAAVLKEGATVITAVLGAESPQRARQRAAGPRPVF
jgi:HlyD family secretion protein